MQRNISSRVGFALPTVLIASVVMLTVLTVSVTSVVSVRTAILTQYYEQVAKTAGEAGVAYAKACLAKNGNIPLWTDAKPLKPSTDCAGNETIGMTSFSTLIVAGGGGGGGSTGGGGGGGGVIEVQDMVLNPGSYTVAVGAGGAISGNQAPGRSGANSSFNSLVAIGGGGGSYSANGNTSAVGLNGGSGGGGQVYHGPRGPGSGTTDQGFDGGSIAGSGSGSTTGGGGAGGPGLNTTTVNGGGAGGPGKLSSLSGLPLYYGGGGGGGAVTGACGALPPSSGGIGGGGNGGDIGSPGQQNTGGGGGGGWCYATGNGGAGGSGVVIIRYPNNGSIDAAGGQEVYVSGSYKIHKFTSVGNSTFTINSISPSSCPTDPRCSVMIDGNLRSSFSVARPTLNGDGRAVAIPNSGYVDLLRESSGEVWRTYRQPTVQAAVVPDLCSGAATSSLGWSRAVETTAQYPLPGITTARTISQVNDSVPAGKMYFRKDFPIVNEGAYSIVASTPSASDKVDIYIDGVYRATAQGSVSTNPVVLTAGCHTITAVLNNQTVVSRASQFTAALQRDGAASPIVATDSEWRVSAGRSVHYSEPEFDADPAIWQSVTDYPTFPTAQAGNSSWQNLQPDIFSRMISPTTNGCPMTCPPSSSTYMRDSKDFILQTNTEVMVSALCDDNCVVYIDGQEILAGAPWNTISQRTLILTQGSHRVGIMLKNTGTVANPSAAAVSVTVKTGTSQLSAGTVMARTDRSWSAANVWTPGVGASADVFSFEKSFDPSPAEVARPKTFDVLVVGGGGGGGGNCNTCGGGGGGGGGGLIFQQDVPATTGARTVIVGGGGAAGVGGASRTSGAIGGGSSFGGISVLGGGGGGAQLGGPGGSGGSGGGGSGGGTPAPGAGGASTAGQGFNGGAGITDPYGGGGGGGAGGNGVNAAGQVSGNGGAGHISYLTGVPRTFGAGGGGGAYSANFAGAADKTLGDVSSSADAGNGVNQNINNGIGYPGNTSRGSGGGGSNGNYRGAAGGAGSAGIVIIRYKAGELTATGGVITNVVIDGTPYVIHTFANVGTFTNGFNITSVN